MRGNDIGGRVAPRRWLLWAVFPGLTLLPPGALEAQVFLRGDANCDGRVSISDSHFLLTFLFRGGPPPKCERSSDTDASGGLNITDAILLVNFLVLGGPSPCKPFPEPGEDPRASVLSCERYSVGPTLEDGAARLRVLNAIVGADGRTTLNLLASSSTDVAGYFAEISIQGARFGEVESVTDLSGALSRGFAGARVFDGKMRVGFLSDITGTARIAGGEDQPVLQINACVESGTAAGDYDMKVESAELADFESGQAILAEGVGDVLAVPEDVRVLGCISPGEPDRESICGRPGPPVDPGPSLDFARGDVNRDGRVSIADSLTIRHFLFSSGVLPPCLDAADANDDGAVDISDMIFILNHLFLGGPELPPPFLDIGPDPTRDSLGCVSAEIVPPSPVREDALSLGIVEALPGASVEVPVLLTNAAEIDGFQLVLRTDLALFDPVERAEGLRFGGSFFEGAQVERGFRSVRNFPDRTSLVVVGFIPDIVQSRFAVPRGENRHVFSIAGRVSPRAQPGTEIPLVFTDGESGQGFGAVGLRNELASRGITRLPQLGSGSIRVIEGALILRGDTSHDGRVTITDALSLLEFLFLGGEAPRCADEADANDDGVLNITDPVAILTTLFLGEDRIRPPFPEPGLDPTADRLSDCR